MTRRDFTNLAISAWGSQAFAQTAVPDSERPNVLIVLADDQGYGDFSSQGNQEIHTPELDRFRGRAARLTDFHSSPMCTPTRAQLMTGRDALYTRAMNVSSGRSLLRRDFPTMPEVFAASGYHTAMFGKWHLGDNFHYRPEDRGFQEAVWFPSSHIGSVPDAWNNAYFNDAYRHNGERKRYQGYCTDVFFDQAMRWMAARHKDGEPFFTYLPLNAAHIPLLVQKKYADRYPSLPPDVARYYGMISNIDENMGKLDTFLQNNRLYDNTIVFYISDNGATGATMRYDAGMRGAKTSLYEGGHRVPCFVRWPGGKIGGGQIDSGKDIGDLTEAQDLLPTLIELCRLKPPAKTVFDGTNLAPVLRGQAKNVKDRAVVVQFSRMNVGTPHKYDSAVMSGKWRLIQNKELYDTATDPAQKKNVIADHPELTARLRSVYEKWWEGVAPFADDFLPVYIGEDGENPTLVSACEWANVFLDQSSQVREGVRKNGVWHLEVERAGDYRVALRRWPLAAKAALNEGVPEYRGELAVFPAGVAIPIAGARLKLGSFDKTIKTRPGDAEAAFEMQLPAGRTTMESWFLDESGQPLLGAYYAYVYRKGAPEVGYEAAKI